MKRFRLHTSNCCLPQIVFATDLKSALSTYVNFGFYIFGSKYKNYVMDFIEGKR